MIGNLAIQDYPLSAQPGKNNAIDGIAFISLMDEPLTYVREYSLATGSINAGFLLSYLVSITEPEQWVRLNSTIIGREIGLTGNEYRNARLTLLNLHVLQNSRLTEPVAGSYYQVNENKVHELMFRVSELKILDMSIPLSINRLQLKAIIGKRGSIKAGLFLASIQELICDEPFNERGNSSKWVEVPNEHIMDRTALSKHEFQSAQKYLLSRSIIELNTQGYPKRKRFRINYQQLAQLTANYWASNGK